MNGAAGRPGVLDGQPATVASAVKRLTFLSAATAALIAATTLAAAGQSGAEASVDEPTAATHLPTLTDFVSGVEHILPEQWRIVESDSGRVPVGWTGPPDGLFVMVEDTGTRFFHPNGFHYYSFYSVWLMPPGWEGEMRHTPYVIDSAPAFLLGMNDDYVALYHTAGGNVWPEGPSEFCSLLHLDNIRYTDLARRVVDMKIEEQLVDAPAQPGRAAFELNPYRIVGLAGDGPGLYLEYVFGDEDEQDDAVLDELTARLAGSVFEKFPDVESLYLRRCTPDTFTDTSLNRD